MNFNLGVKDRPLSFLPSTLAGDVCSELSNCAFVAQRISQLHVELNKLDAEVRPARVSDFAKLLDGSQYALTPEQDPKQPMAPTWKQGKIGQINKEIKQLDLLFSWELLNRLKILPQSPTDIFH